jgi:hypothetical protein
MYRLLFFIGMVLCIFSFGYFLLSLMGFTPLYIAIPLLFVSIFFTVHCYNQNYRRTD